MVNPALPEIAKGLNIKSQTIAALIVSLDILGFIVSGVLSAPLSEIYGRRPLYTLSSICFAALTLACGFAPNIAVLLALRFIAGALGTACLVLGGATCADLFDPQQRAQAMAVWASVILLGPNVGPIVGGVVVQAKGWRWVFYIFAIAGGVNVALCALLMPETAAVVLKRRIARLEAGTETTDSCRSNMASLRALAQPLKLLFFSPVVFIMALYSAITHAVVYLLFTSIPFTFSPEYHFSPRTTGLLYLAPGLGMMFGAFAGGYLGGRIAKSTMAGGDTHTPEKRLDPAVTFPGGFLMVAGLILYGFSVQYHVHYMSALAGLLMYGFGLAFTATVAQTYVVESHLEYAASVTAAFTVPTSILSGVLPVSGVEIFSSLGMGWGNVLLAGIVAISMTAFVMCRAKGAYLRDRFRVE